MTNRTDAQAGIDAQIAKEGVPNSITPTSQSTETLQPILDGAVMSDELSTNGIADYNDTTTSVTPITLVANTWTTITNDGAGSFTNLAYLPSDTTGLMDTSDGSFDFSELTLGDNVLIRNDYEVTPNVNNALLEIRYELGTGSGVYTLPTVLGRLDDGSGKPYRKALKPDMIYMGDTNTRDNKIAVQLRLSSNGTVVNYGSAIGVIKI